MPRRVRHATRENARLLNPMCFIDDEKTDVAPHWYIRHGARDRDTSFPVPLNLALKLQNAGKEVKSFDDLVICDRLRPIRDQKDKIVKKSQPFDWD